MQLFCIIIYICFYQCVNGYVKETEEYHGWKLIEVKGLQPNESSDLWSWLDSQPTSVPLRFNKIKGTLTAVVSGDLDVKVISKWHSKKVLSVTIASSDFGKDLNREKIRAKRTTRKETFFSRYRPYSEMLRYMSKLELLYPNHIRKEIIGTSAEGRELLLYTITNQQRSFISCARNTNQTTPNNRVFVKPITASNTNLLTPVRSRNGTHKFIYLALQDLLNQSGRTQGPVRFKKPVIFIDAGSHSREWVSPAATLYLMDKLLSRDASLVDDLEWKIIPMANPDGYIHSWQHNRLWRKTRSKTTNPDCFGVDMNRNYDFHFGEVDTSKNPCEEHYGGPNAFSEAETIAIKNAVLAAKSRIKAYFTIHNWGQEIMYPMSHSSKFVPKNIAYLKKVAQEMSGAIKKRGGVQYKTGRASVNLYPSSGTVTDWAFAKQNIPLSFTLEMRDLGSAGFFLPQKLIQPTGEDLHAAMEVMGATIRKQFLTQNSCDE